MNLSQQPEYVATTWVQDDAGWEALADVTPVRIRPYDLGFTTIVLGDPVSDRPRLLRVDRMGLDEAFSPQVVMRFHSRNMVAFPRGGQDNAALNIGYLFPLTDVAVAQTRPGGGTQWQCDPFPPHSEYAARHSGDLPARNRVHAGWADIRDPLSHFDFLEGARTLERFDDTAAALDLVYDYIDDLMANHRFGLVAWHLHETDVNACSVDILLSLLTSTLPAKRKIATRADFVRRVEAELQRRGEDIGALLMGLS